MTDTLVTRPRLWQWLGTPGETIAGLESTGWPDSLEGETVALTIDGHTFDPVVEGDVTDGVVSFPTFDLPEDEGTYVTRLTLDGDNFARGRLLARDGAVSNITDATLTVEVLGITFEMTVTTRGATAAQAAAIAANTAAIAAHIADAVAAHAATAISAAVAGLSATEVNAALSELLDDLTALPTLADGLTTRVDDSTPGILRVEQLVHRLSGAQIASSASELTAFAPSPFTLEPGTIQMGSTQLRIIAKGQIANNTGVDRTATIRFKVGATTIATYTTPALASNATARPIELRLDISTLSFGSDFLVPIDTSFVTIGAPGNVGAKLVDRQPFTSLGNATIDPDAEIDLDITAQLSFSSAQFSFLVNTEIEQVEPVVWAG